MGHAPSDVLVTCDGETAPVYGGCFVIGRSLVVGENEFTIAAKTPDGKKQELVVHIDRRFWTPFYKGIATVIVVGAILAVFELWLLFRKGGERVVKKEKHSADSDENEEGGDEE